MKRVGDSPLLRRLAEARPLLLDGAMGTALLERGLSLPHEDAISWSLTRPEVVLEIHRAHVQAGAALVLANTFGARVPTAIEMSAAIALARESGAAWIGVPLWPGLPGRSFAEAVRTVSSAGQGGDVLWLETAMQLADAERALRIAREETDLPIAITLALAAFPASPLASGVNTLKENLAALIEQGAAIVGLNCGPWELEPAPARTRTLASHGCAALAPDQRALSPALDLAALVSELTRELCVPFAIKPDAGQRDPGAWAQAVAAAVGAGAKLAGGCCGTGAVHLEALRGALAI